MWWAKSAPQVGIGLTDLPKIGGCNWHHDTPGSGCSGLVLVKTFENTYTQVQAKIDVIKETQACFQ